MNKTNLAAQLKRVEPIEPNESDQASLASIHQLFDQQSSCALIGKEGQKIELPESVYEILKRVVEVMHRGDSITVVPVGKTLTSQQAANLLNISRQYLIRLLEEDKLPYEMLNTHRRLKLTDVLAYKKERDQTRKSKLDKLSELSQDYGGYKELK